MWSKQNKDWFFEREGTPYGELARGIRKRTPQSDWSGLPELVAALVLLVVAAWVVESFVGSVRSLTGTAEDVEPIAPASEGAAPQRSSRPQTAPATGAAARSVYPAVPERIAPDTKPDAIRRTAAVFADAKHKHRGNDCEGVLVLTADMVTYRTSHPEDSFEYPINAVKLDNDGFTDPSGKNWHFRVAGRNMEDVFRRWKAGVLPLEDIAPIK